MMKNPPVDDDEGDTDPPDHALSFAHAPDREDEDVTPDEEATADNPHHLKDLMLFQQQQQQQHQQQQQASSSSFWRGSNLLQQGGSSQQQYHYENRLLVQEDLLDVDADDMLAPTPLAPGPVLRFARPSDNIPSAVSLNDQQIQLHPDENQIHDKLIISDLASLEAAAGGGGDPTMTSGSFDDLLAGGADDDVDVCPNKPDESKAHASPVDAGSKSKSITEACRDDQWNTKLQELVGYVRQHGNALVPNSYPPNQSLAQWTKRQRYQYKLRMNGQHSTLTDERMEALEMLGFVWDSHKAIWMERYDELLDFVRRHGHAKVPTKHPDNPALAVWVKCQRRQFKLFFHGKPSNMTMERAQLLARANFVFNPRNLRDGTELTREQVQFMESLQQGNLP